MNTFDVGFDSPDRMIARIEGSQQTPPCAAPQSWLDVRPKYRPASATALSFPFQPQGAHQLSFPSHVAIQASDHFDDCQVGLLNHHHHRRHLTVSLPVHTIDEENWTAIDGAPSFENRYNDRANRSSTSIGSQISAGIEFAYFSDHLSKRDPYHNRVYSVPLPFATPYTRSLTSNSNTLNYEMTTTITAPNSPPDLSGSKSSKSSSFQSSQFDSPEGISNDVSNFEEIGLEEDAHGVDAEPTVWERNGFAKRQSSRVSSTGPRSMPPAREPTNGNKRPTYPSLQGQVQYALSHKSTSTSSVPRSFTEGGLTRGFTAPSTATFPMPAPAPQPRTRSSSPSPKMPLSASFAVTGHNLRNGPPIRSAGPPSRRGSWQPSRKTIKELEAEYHDSDDELPEEYSLWNVPVSPCPTTARPSSNKSSNRGSPEREEVASASRPIPLSHAVSAPESPPRNPMSRSLPRNRPPPRTSSLQQPATFTANSPTSPRSSGFFRDTRAKSWTLAMADLSEEARELTEALEYHADSKGRLHEEHIQNGTKSCRPSMDSNARRSARSSAIELPPIQKGNILIDPMPLSKEKEAVLTRTRPSWLPPKDPKEERRHLNEYQRMMAASLNSEKVKVDKVKARQCEKDDTREALNRIWEQYVCPDWERITQEHRTRELWWNGVSPKLRGKVWMRAIGNPLGLTPKSYERALSRVKDLQSRPRDDLTEKERSMRSWFADVERDANFAFPDLNLFQKNGPMRRDLVDVCCAYASYRSDVGYVYGIQVSFCGR
jgi:Rab-GTPase-TBC domain